jgi:hypothetical protein
LTGVFELCNYTFYLLFERTKAAFKEGWGYLRYHIEPIRTALQDKKLRSRTKFRLLALILAMTSNWAVGTAIADIGVYNNLRQSRDAILAQRSRLQEAHDKLAKQIDYLQSQQDKVDAYLNDNDRALRDVDRALAQTQ